MGRLENRRVLVVGGSRGIGLATSIAIAREGARVAVAARRADVLAAAVAEVGSAAVGIVCDVARPEDCERAVAEAVRAFGGLDAVVYAPGVTLFAPVAQMDADAWRSTFEINVFGAALVARAALPHLREKRGRVVFFSSIVIDDRPPRYAMAPYVASKAALESLAQAFQGEHPELGFTTIAIGDTESEKAEVVDPHVLEEYVPRWIAGGVMHGRLMTAAPVAEQVVNVLASSENVRRLAIWPMAPAPAS